MLKIIFIALWSMVCLFADQSSAAKAMKLAQKGERIAKVMCEQSKLPQATGGIEKIKQKVKASGACRHLSSDKLEAVAYYLQQGSVKEHSQHLAVPDDAKCPVCGMFVSKYPKWAAMMKHDGKVYYFDGVKDMMKYYIFDGDFPYERTHISQMVVSDYYTIEAIPAKEAFYVLDADVFGPMGHELIAFKDKKSAQTFMDEHHGKKIVKFDEITDKMVMALDGIEQ
ncbi:nitrous oxide reductase accessory protein NosL [Sulfurovum sp.]|uniref:nitrous oxide reductase accessory protein NosL n=1 Tax=Sulfurovum sp. TaxID=1969726 RepID=UPI0025FB0473|nr:nitrous oxide reductase accessory protein NosL [Sulfurovum sp.]